jgi:Skp family chaperone for outer membrane proteins
VVDSSKLLTDSIEGKKILDALQKIYADEQNKAKTMQDELKAMADELQKKGDALSPEARAEKEEELKSKGAKFERTLQSVSQQLDATKGRALGAYQEKVKAFIESWGKRQGHALIIDLGAALYSDGSMDVTAGALKDLNEAYIAAGQPEPKIEYGGGGAPAPRPASTPRPPAPKSGTTGGKKP